jgi:hypothetical protein
MAKSTGITLTAVAIGMGNEYVQGYGVNFRMGMAGLGAALFLTGIEKINETAGVGLSVLVMITVLLTPFKGKAPSQEVLSLIQSKSPAPAKVTVGPANPATGRGGIA